MKTNGNCNIQKGTEMNKKLIMIWMASVPFFLHGAEYTVTPADSLQKAVQALRPGDTLTLLPGVYRQGTVAIRCRGSQESPIVIQGKDRENTLVTAWKSLDTVTWEPVPGKPFVYRAAWAEDTYGISDLANKRNMMPAPGADDMERFRGTYFYDRKEHYLYCHSFTGCKPGKGLRATVRSGYLFELNTAEHVVIRNLTFCGSAHENPRLSSLAVAIRTIRTRNILVENCHFHYNSGGLAFTANSIGCTARNCFFLRNEARGYGEAAQLFFGGKSKYCLAENNIIADTEVHGLRFYSGAEHCTARGNIIVNARLGLYYKASRPPRLAERNVVLGCSLLNYSDLSGGRPITDTANTFEAPSRVYDDNPSNLIFGSKNKPVFCAPEYYDFRLQRHDGNSGRGAYPGSAPVVYVAVDGSDNADGGSRKTAFRTFARAARELLPGTTLYLAPGNYGNVKWSGKEVTIRGLGSNPHVVFKSLDISGSRNIELANIKVDTLNLKQCEDIRLKRVAGRRIDDSANAVLFRCSFDNLKNIYHPESPWLEGPFDPEPSSRATAVPAGRIRTFGDRATVRWEQPGFSTDAIRKRDEWWAPIPVSSFLEYGTTPEMTQRAYSTGELFHRVNLYGLTSGKDYYARIVIPEEPLLYENGIGIRKVNGNVARGEIFRFTVPPYSAAHRKLFVAQNGSDAADGSEKRPWRTLAKAAAEARPGDTVFIRPGIYHQSLVPENPGRPGAPITFRAEIPGTVILDGSNYLRPGGICIQNLEYINLSGFVLRHFANKQYSCRGGMDFGMIQLRDSRHISLSQCVLDGNGTYQNPLVIVNCHNISVTDNVFLSGVTSISGAYNGNLAIFRNTSYVPLIRHISLQKERKDAKVAIRKNLFVALTRAKTLARTARIVLNPRQGNYDLDDNLWYFSPEDPWRYCGGEGDAPSLDSMAGLKRFHAKTGLGKNDRFITDITFKGHHFIDPMKTKEYAETLENLTEGPLSVKTFELSGFPGYGACPAETTVNGGKK